jgi:antitoxin YefM
MVLVMQTVNYSTFRSELSDSMDKVTKNHTPMVVTRGSKKEAVVMMSLEDFKAYEETAYLMRSMNNYKRLQSSVEEIESGFFIQKELIEE